MKDKLQTFLNKYFNCDTFRPYQREIIENVLQGNDVFVRFPTGMGKSLCYQLPSLLLDGMVIVISPLISLMKDQVDNLITRGISATFLNSTIPSKKYELIKSNCIQGKYKILYISPEGLIKEFSSLIMKLKIGLFAIDEAHTIEQWGYDFRPEYSNLNIIKKTFKDIPLIALTASVTDEAQKAILKNLCIENAVVFSRALFRPNISLTVRKNKSGREKVTSIIELAYFYRYGCGIVFCNTRRIASSIANKLKFRGINALAYHAGLSKNDRTRIQSKFIAGEVQVICATIAFGMGIDKADIRWIVHYNIPQNIETYYQEIGRAGRDGKPSEAVLFYNKEDIPLIETFAQRSGNIILNMDKLERVNQYAKTRKCRWKYIVDYFGEDEPIVNCQCDNCKIDKFV